ncbi:MAG: hypothetical protein ACKVHP_16615, partial [Verrucomicrobiales bacterium]
AVELIHATPLEYLRRWIAANEVFGDAVALESVVRWADGQMELSHLAPHNHSIGKRTFHVLDAKTKKSVYSGKPKLRLAAKGGED